MTDANSLVRVLVTPHGDLEYEVKRSRHRRTLGIVVEPDRRVVVTIPVGADEVRVEKVLAKRVRWIAKQRRRIEQLPVPPTPREWCPGETHRFLGRQYRLKLVDSDAGRVRLMGGHFVVETCRPRRASDVERLMRKWYLEHARKVFGERVQRVLSSTTWLAAEQPTIIVRSLKNQWGSASPTGRVVLNIDLIKVALPCIDYVIAHELCHLRIANHSAAFWRLLTRVMPEWERWRERLDRAEI